MLESPTTEAETESPALVRMAPGAPTPGHTPPGPTSTTAALPAASAPAASATTATASREAGDNARATNADAVPAVDSTVASPRHVVQAAGSKLQGAIFQPCLSCSRANPWAQCKCQSQGQRHAKGHAVSVSKHAPFAHAAAQQQQQHPQHKEKRPGKGFQQHQQQQQPQQQQQQQQQEAKERSSGPLESPVQSTTAVNHNKLLSKHEAVDLEAASILFSLSRRTSVSDCTTQLTPSEGASRSGRRRTARRRSANVTIEDTRCLPQHQHQHQQQQERRRRRTGRKRSKLMSDTAAPQHHPGHRIHSASRDSSSLSGLSRNMQEALAMAETLSPSSADADDDSSVFLSQPTPTTAPLSTTALSSPSASGNNNNSNSGGGGGGAPSGSSTPGGKGRGHRRASSTSRARNSRCHSQRALSWTPSTAASPAHGAGAVDPETEEALVRATLPLCLQFENTSEGPGITAESVGQSHRARVERLLTDFGACMWDFFDRHGLSSSASLGLVNRAEVMGDLSAPHSSADAPGPAGQSQHHHHEQAVKEEERPEVLSDIKHEAMEGGVSLGSNDDHIPGVGEALHPQTIASGKSAVAAHGNVRVSEDTGPHQCTANSGGANGCSVASNPGRKDSPTSTRGAAMQSQIHGDVGCASASEQGGICSQDPSCAWQELAQGELVEAAGVTAAGVEDPLTPTAEAGEPDNGDADSQAKRAQYFQENQLYAMSRSQFRQFLQQFRAEVQEELKKMRRRAGHRMAKRRQRARQRRRESNSEAQQQAALLRGHLKAALKHLETVFLASASPPEQQQL